MERERQREEGMEEKKKKEGREARNWQDTKILRTGIRNNLALFSDEEGNGADGIYHLSRAQ